MRSIKNTSMALATATLLLISNMSWADATKKYVTARLEEGTFSFNAPKGVGAEDAYSKLAAGAKQAYTGREKIKSVQLLQDGNLVYSIEPQFFLLMGKNQVRPELKQEYLKRIMGIHSFNSSGNRAFGGPRNATPAALQRIHRKQFDQIMATWTGSDSDSLSWKNAK